MKVVPPSDWSQCPECGVPMDYVEPVGDVPPDSDANKARVIASPCRHTFEVLVG